MKNVFIIICTVFFIVSCSNHKIGNEGVTEDTVSLEVPEAVNEPEPAKAQGFEGSYYCGKSGDTYIFNNGTGEFYVSGSDNPETFRWNKTGNKIVLTYVGNSAYLGKQELTYNEKEQTITEESASLGTLTFNKE